MCRDTHTHTFLGLSTTSLKCFKRISDKRRFRIAATTKDLTPFFSMVVNWNVKMLTLTFQFSKIKKIREKWFRYLHFPPKWKQKKLVFEILTVIDISNNLNYDVPVTKCTLLTEHKLGMCGACIWLTRSLACSPKYVWLSVLACHAFESVIDRPEVQRIDSKLFLKHDIRSFHTSRTHAFIQTTMTTCRSSHFFSS